MNLTLHEIILNKNCRFDFSGEPHLVDRQLAGISIDSRKIQSGELYFALKGDQHDGHEFIHEVFKKQALAAVVNRGWRQAHKEAYPDKPILVVEDTLSALQECANSYRKTFSLPVLALTGTNGKTTTKEMIAAVLGKSGSICKTEGNLNNHIGVPLTLFKLTELHKSLVLEMGTNHFGEIWRLCEIAEPDFGLITNIGYGHLEFLQNLAGVAREKLDLFKFLSPSGVAFVNIDDPFIENHSLEFERSVKYGFKEEADISGEKLSAAESGAARLKVNEQVINLNMPGEHNLANALAAVAVGLEFGVTMNEIKDALEHVRLPDNRMHILKKDTVLILNDSYNANPDSTMAALTILKQTPTSGKKIFVFGDMLELGESSLAQHAKIGESLKEFGVDIFLAFGPHSIAAVEASRKTSKHIISQHFSDKKQLISALKNHLEKEVVILVKGSRGMKMEQVLTELFNEHIRH